MYGVVLDPSSLILCSRSGDKQAVRRLGDLVYGLRELTIYLSRRLVRQYKTIVVPMNQGHHPLPKFQSSLSNLVNRILLLIRRTRPFCKVIKGKVTFHILEKSRIEGFNVEDLGLREEEDKEILRIGLTATRWHEKSFLVTLDKHFLEALNWRRLSERCSKETERLKVVRPDDPDLIAVLKAMQVS